ncbi:hypothetical protein GCM10009665_46750 [Kitasatospora nipponensis]|uniref:Acyl-CoA carboxylase epsilon subunit-like protein n=1 Tax=Kitasatospora nipponensis TaxID=258049 RepID=A0ABP4H546_9ACTN
MSRERAAGAGRAPGEEPRLRVLRGRPDPVELAALVLVLRRAAAAAGGPAGGSRPVAPVQSPWDREGVPGGHRPAGSWYREGCGW